MSVKCLKELYSFADASEISFGVDGLWGESPEVLSSEAGDACVR